MANFPTSIDSYSADTNVVGGVGGTTIQAEDVNEGRDFAIAAQTKIGVDGDTLAASTLEGRQKYDDSGGLRRYGSNITSASSITLPDNYSIFRITGTTTIATVVAPSYMRLVYLEFAAALTLSHGTGNLHLAGGVNVSVTAGSVIAFEWNGTGWYQVGGGGTSSSTIVVQDEGSSLPARPTLNFRGSAVAATDDSTNNRTNIDIVGGTGGHIIQDEGTSRTGRTNLNFVGAGVAATDDAGNDATLVTIPGITVQDEASSLTQRQTVNFIGAGVTAVDNSGSTRTDVTIPGPAVQSSGADLTNRPKLNFSGTGVSVTDDAGNNRTNITISGGSGSAHVVQDEGSPLTQRGVLNFKGDGVAAADNSGAGATDVTIPGGRFATAAKFGW